jgi:hypothetical protein
MKISKKIINRLSTDLNFKNGLQSAMGLPESTLRYRIKNNTRLDEKKALEYFKANGYDDKKLFQ